ncbi:fad binding domain-containing [Trichoderma arundinaceum]|uniref:Fad binding domain-containing n=1 Tax=Trichoderma arundinaceum TaxID=490622 RepID=A0A395NZJ9_TRIAR|nr:fad binding domain-containing [Trichoderma arundinaceum]
MSPLKRFLTFALPMGCKALGTQPDTAAPLPQECCKAIHDLLPSIVHGIGTEEYNGRLGTYYSYQQHALSPACVVKPTSANDVSRILRIASLQDCAFAVASGGHMAWPESSNTGDGFLFDLRDLNQIDISLKDQTISLGPGSKWTSVYAAMSVHNVTTAGARVNDVGVGGFLLGGGVAYMSNTHGFGSNTVFNYEVVLSDGTIINANSTSHADLFWALRLAGTNYGIVTRFDMPIFPSPAIWGAVTLYPATEQSTSEIFADYEKYNRDNDNVDTFKSAVFVNMPGQNDMMMTVIVNSAGQREPPMTSVDHIQQAEKLGSTHIVVSDVMTALLEAPVRTAWFTMTTRVNRQLFLDLNKMLADVFQPFEGKSGLSLAMGYQAFQKSYIEATHDSPVYNSMKEADDDLTLILLMVTWKDPKDDKEMKKATARFGKLAEQEATKRNLFSNFIYLNYANGC